jgi:hypothetical protein
MLVKKTITEKAIRLLNNHIPADDRSWRDITELARCHGCAEVISAFEAWVSRRAGEAIAHPLKEFVRLCGRIIEERASS